jgi:hypothetical protein
MLTIDLALTFEDCTISFGPRDVASQEWMANGGELHMRDPLYQLHRDWVNRGISRRDLPVIASHFEHILNRLVSFELWREAPDVWSRLRDVRFRVRACEYRDVVVSQELVEL